MICYGIEMEGSLTPEQYSSKPSWSSDDEATIIYVTGEDKFYYGGSSDWVEM